MIFHTSTRSDVGIGIERGAKRVITGIIGGPVADSHGNVVVPAGCVTDNLPVALLHTHDRDKVLGTVTFAWARGSAVHWRAEFADIREPGPLKAFLDVTWQQVQAGMLRCVSGAYHPLVWRERRMGEFGDGKGLYVSKWRLKEISLCAMGANHTSVIRTATGTNPPDDADPCLRAWQAEQLAHADAVFGRRR